MSKSMFLLVDKSFYCLSSLFDAKNRLWLIYDPKIQKGIRQLSFCPIGKVRNCAFDLGNKTIVKDLKIGRDGYYFESPTREGAIIHGYPDPVHLLKLIRNHTLDSVMEVMIDGRKTTVSKEDLVKLTNLDAPAYEIRACHKLGKPSKKRIFYDI